VVHPEVKTPAMTGQWEAYLKKINQGEAQLTPFIEGINGYVRDVVDKVRVTPRRRFAPPPAASAQSAPESAPVQQPARKPAKGALLAHMLEEQFGYKKFLTGQKAACMAALAGKDYLLALPGGGGKSLCSQVAGLALDGTTLVVCANTAWMEEQVAKLRERGVAAECIHAGRDRDALRAACVDYLNGRLQFLYFAPERLSVAGVPQMLAKRKPALVAIEEANRIVPASEQHLPEYALLREALPLLRPVPVLALTAASAPKVQTEIAERLGLNL